MKMTRTRELRKNALVAANSVVVIGVAFNPADDHIVKPVRAARRGLYIGSADHFAQWREVNSRFIHLAETFEAGLPRLLILLKITPRWRAVCHLVCQAMRNPSDTMRFVQELW
jgi:hypothetical protein